MPSLLGAKVNANTSPKVPPKMGTELNVRSPWAHLKELVIRKGCSLAWGICNPDQKQVRGKWLACIQSWLGTNYIKVALLLFSHPSGLGGPSRPLKTPRTRSAWGKNLKNLSKYTEANYPVFSNKGNSFHVDEHLINEHKREHISKSFTWLRKNAVCQQHTGAAEIREKAWSPPEVLWCKENRWCPQVKIWLIPCC